MEQNRMITLAVAHDTAYRSGFIAGYIFFYVVLIGVPILVIRGIWHRFRG
jgi:hypothetical protein